MLPVHLLTRTTMCSCVSEHTMVLVSSIICQGWCIAAQVNTWLYSMTQRCKVAKQQRRLRRPFRVSFPASDRCIASTAATPIGSKNIGQRQKEGHKIVHFWHKSCSICNASIWTILAVITFVPLISCQAGQIKSLLAFYNVTAIHRSFLKYEQEKNAAALAEVYFQQPAPLQTTHVPCMCMPWAQS